jgi:hypothetical protein
MSILVAELVYIRTAYCALTVKFVICKGKNLETPYVRCLSGRCTQKRQIPHKFQRVLGPNILVIMCHDKLVNCATATEILSEYEVP